MHFILLLNFFHILESEKDFQDNEILNIEKASKVTGR